MQYTSVSLMVENISFDNFFFLHSKWYTVYCIKSITRYYEGILCAKFLSTLDIWIVVLLKRNLKGFPFCIWMWQWLFFLRFFFICSFIIRIIYILKIFIISWTKDVFCLWTKFLLKICSWIFESWKSLISTEPHLFILK